MPMVAAAAVATATLSVATTPAHAQTITPGFFGMHDSDWTTPAAVPVGAANLTTAGTYWPSIETSNGTFDWTRLDQQVAAARKSGAQPMIVLGQSPKFHSSKPGSADYADYMPSTTAWSTYVTKVAQRYGTRLDYQIWPEPNNVMNWKGSVQQMAQLTVIAAKAIHAAAGRNAKVVSPAMALRLPQQVSWTVKYFKTLGRTSVQRDIDAIAIDPFPAPGGTPEDTYRMMTSIKQRLARMGVRKPFWNNEINYGVAGAGASTRTRYPVAKQQSYVIRTFVLSAAAGMQRTYWLGWFNSPEVAISMADSHGRALAPAKAYAAVRSWLTGTNFRGCTTTRSGLWVCTAKKSRREVHRIYWDPKGRTAITTPRSTIQVQTQDGGVVRRAASRKIRVGYQPVMVSSRK